MTMTKRTVGLISIALVAIIGLGTMVTIPVVSAETRRPAAKQTVTAKQTLAPADQAKLQALKALYKQIGDTAKLIRDKIKAAKTAGKDLSAFAADLKTAGKYAVHRAASHGIMLTEAERSTLEAMQTSIHTLEQQFRALRKAKAPQAVLDSIKAQTKAAVAARTTYLKTIHAAALAQYSNRLDILIADANMKLAFLQGLLTRLP